MPSSGYTLMDIPYPKQTLVHVHPDSSELGRVYRPELAINADPSSFVAALTTLAPAGEPRWVGRTAALHQTYLDWSTPPVSGPGDVAMGPIMAWLEDNLPADAIMTNGAGNYATWLHRFHRFRRFGTQAAPASGSMGYGLPAAVAAKAMFPEREVVCFAGDGCFLMHGQEFATAVRYDLPIIVVVINNGIYGTIRMHQEREYPGRVVGTDLKNPDFAALARACGGHGETVEKTADFAMAFERARASGKPAIVEIRLDPEAITARKQAERRVRIEQAVNDRGLARGDRTLEGRAELLGRLDALAMPAKGARIGRKVRILQRRRRDAARILPLLMHPDRPIHAVVDDDDDDREVILDGRGEILPVHQEAAIAGEGHDGALRIEPLGADRSRHAIAHRARGRGQLRRELREAVEAVHPGRVIARAIAQDRIVRQVVAQPAHHFARVEGAGDRGRLLAPAEIGFMRRRGGTGP
eukprot:gene39317-53149_t